MRNKIGIQGEEIRYELRVSRRARRMRIAVLRSGEVVATVPRFLNRRHAERFMKEKESWISRKINYFKNHTRKMLVPASARHYAEYRERALEFVKARTFILNTLYRFPYSSITIRNQKTRWGSCSRKGSLNFNYRILFLPVELADYLIVHELCHLKHFNHSSKFWALVAQMCPDYKANRKSLKQYELRVG